MHPNCKQAYSKIEWFNTRFYAELIGIILHLIPYSQRMDEHSCHFLLFLKLCSKSFARVRQNIDVILVFKVAIHIKGKPSKISNETQKYKT